MNTEISDLNRLSLEWFISEGAMNAALAIWRHDNGWFVVHHHDWIAHCCENSTETPGEEMLI